METNMDEPGLQQQYASNNANSYSGDYFFDTNHALTDAVASDDLPPKTGGGIEKVHHTDSLHSVMGPPTLMDKLIYYMERLETRMNGVECKIGEIVNLLRTYETLVLKVGESTFPIKEVNAADTGRNRGETEITNPLVNSSQGNTIMRDQSQQTSEPHSSQNTTMPYEKDKAVDLDPNLNLIVPNSDGENDEVFINERLSTPKIFKSLDITVTDAPTDSPWVGGNQKQFQTQPIIRSTGSYKYNAMDLPTQPYPTYSLIGKKLFMTPSPSKRPPKRPRGLSSTAPSANARDSPTICTPGRRSATQHSGLGLDKKSTKMIPKNPALLLPKNFRTYFKPTPQMGLSKPDCQLGAYIFSADMDQGEMLFIYKETRIHRQVFLSLSPGQIVDPELIFCMALKTTWSQTHGHMVTTWSFPASFSHDALSGMTAIELIDLYGQAWMPSTCFLQFVYVPFHEEDGHWYLMVISISERKIYALDTYPTNQKIVPRRNNMAIVSGLLAEMLSEEPFATDFINEPPQLNTWDIIDGRGIPNKGTSVDSAVWVLGWLDLEYAFTGNLSGVLDEPRVRMTTATKLASATFNQQSKIVESRAESFWNSLVNG